MKTIYKDLKYNLEGYEVRYTEYPTVTEIVLKEPLFKEEIVLKMGEAYRVMIALQKVLRANDSNYEEKMMSNIERKEEIL